MPRRSDSNGSWWSFAILVWVPLLLVQSAHAQWTLQTLAQDFCNAVASNQQSSCNCVDTEVIPGQGQNLCGYNQALGPGLTIDSSTFTGWDANGTPTPSTNILAQEECDARGATNNIQCTGTSSQTVTAQTTTTYTVGTGLKESLSFTVDGFGGGADISFSFEQQSSTQTGNSVTASETCGPSSAGQTAGTCTLYTETYQSLDFPNGRGFTYDSVISGGVQMSFSPPVDLDAATGQPGDGSTHYYWWAPIDLIVSFGQSSSGNLNNANQFDPTNSGSGNPVTFHGSGTITGNFLDVSTECIPEACP